MELTPIQQQALSRWHELGDTTPTHPVLQLAYDLYFTPMGIRADALRYDALAALQDRSLRPTLINPRFDPNGIKNDWSQFSIIEPLTKVTDLVIPAFNSNGSISEFVIIKDTDAKGGQMDAAEQKRLEDFKQKHAQAIFDLSGALAHAVYLFSSTSLELIIQPEPISSQFAQNFVNNPRQFALMAFTAFTAEEKK